MRIQDYFPLKIFFNVGAFKCNGYFSFQTSQPSEKNHQKHVIIKQQKIIVIQKPQEHDQYLYISLLSDFSTQIKLKAWFQQSQYDRSYFLCYYGQDQHRKRTYSYISNKTEPDSYVTDRNNATIIINTNNVEKSILTESSVPPIKSFNENYRYNNLRQKSEQIPLKKKTLIILIKCNLKILKNANTIIQVVKLIKDDEKIHQLMDNYSKFHQIYGITQSSFQNQQNIKIHDQIFKNICLKMEVEK